MRVFTLLILLVIVLLGVSFATLNAQVVEVNYYFGTVSMPVSLLIVGSMAIGMVFGVLFSVLKLIRALAENARLRQRVKIVEKEVENLRAIPLKNEH